MFQLIPGELDNHIPPELLFDEDARVLCGGIFFANESTTCLQVRYLPSSNQIFEVVLYLLVCFGTNQLKNDTNHFFSYHSVILSATLTKKSWVVVNYKCEDSDLFVK